MDSPTFEQTQSARKYEMEQNIKELEERLEQFKRSLTLPPVSQFVYNNLRPLEFQDVGIERQRLITGVEKHITPGNAWDACTLIMDAIKAGELETYRYYGVEHVRFSQATFNFLKGVS